VRKVIFCIVASVLGSCLLIWALPSGTEASPSNATGVNSCVDCHLSLEVRFAVPAREWINSVHAEYEVLCTDCHGGDASSSSQEAAMSEGSGFIGRPPRDQIPQLCGDCHADPERMAPYGLPTNQLREYYELSKHGQVVAQGDEVAATCYDCHGGHATQDTESPRSAVYPVNLPQTCGKCHSDAKLMEPYGIDTHQYELFRSSVHGVALLEEQNLRAPTCATCHGNHGAALPGLGEMVDTCGLQCHPLAEDAYLLGAHGSGAGGTSDAPNCVTCHGRYDVQEANEEMLVGSEARDCASCHTPGSPEGQIVSTLYQEISSAASAVVEAESVVDTPEEVHLLLQAQTRLKEARVLQHTVQLDLVQDKTEEARALSAQVQEDQPGPGSMATAEWNMVLLIGGILVGIVICLVLVGFAWTIMKR